jgi:hypothetical protein
MAVDNIQAIKHNSYSRTANNNSSQRVGAAQVCGVMVHPHYLLARKTSTGIMANEQLQGQMLSVK